MTPEEIQTLLGIARLYESGNKPYNWPETPDKVIGDMADAMEQLQIEAEKWKRKSEHERKAFASLLHCGYRGPICPTIEEKLLKAHIEAEHWREAYYDERAKYLNLINNK